MPSPIINLIITADYELFLGRNFVSNDEVLFNPTQQMIDICDGLNVPITFFADVCSVWAHQKQGLTNYVEKFENQMRQACLNNHDVQLHLHPHWLFSNYEKDEWQISSNRMYLADLGYQKENDSAPAVIKRGVDYLNNLLKPVSPHYQCIAFRAAGLALQPLEKELIKSLMQNNIRIDSSIAKGLKLDMDTIRIDYSKTPDEANWFMAEETGINIPALCGLLEIPIATFKVNFIDRLNFLIKRVGSIRMRRGGSFSRSEKQSRWSGLKILLDYNLRYIFSNPWFSLSCDTKGYSLNLLLNGFDDYIERHSDNEQIFISMINHPKLMFTPQFELLKSFIEKVREHYGEKIRFISFGEALTNINSMLNNKI